MFAEFFSSNIDQISAQPIPRDRDSALIANHARSKKLLMHAARKTMKLLSRNTSVIKP